MAFIARTQREPYRYVKQVNTVHAPHDGQTHYNCRVAPEMPVAADEVAGQFQKIAKKSGMRRFSPESLKESNLLVSCSRDNASAQERLCAFEEPEFDVCVILALDGSLSLAREKAGEAAPTLKKFTTASTQAFAWHIEGAIRFLHQGVRRTA